MEMKVITLACFSISKLTDHYLAVKKKTLPPDSEAFLESMKI